MSAARQVQAPHDYHVFAMQRAIKTAPLKPAARLLMFVLSTYCNAEGRCWPGVPQLAKDTGHSRSTIFRALKQLEDAGYITKLPRMIKGRNTSNRYKLHVVPCAETNHLPPPPLRVSSCDGGGVMVTPKLSREQSIQPEEEERNTDSGPESSAGKPRAQVLELPPRMPPAFVSSASPHLISEHGVAQPPPQQPVPPVSVVVDGGVGGSNAEPVEQREAEDTPPTSATEHTPVHRLPVWLEGATRLDEGKRATKSEVIAVVKRAQWDSTALNLALLWCYVPPGVLSWAVELAEDDAAELPRDDVRRIGILRRKFRYKIRDWATGEDGPVHGRRKLDEGRTGSRHNVSPGVVGVDYSAKYRRAQKTPDALEGVVSKGGES